MSETSQRADIRILEARVTQLEHALSRFPEEIDKRHKENRLSIHDLGNCLQEIRDSIHELDLKMARMLGYGAGAGAVIAVAWKVLDKLWK